MKNHLTIIFVLSLFGIIAVVGAQEPSEESSDVALTDQAWLLTDLDAKSTDEPEAAYVVFLSLDDGATLIEVASGADLVYTRGEDDLYSGTPLIPTDAYEFDAVLEIIDEDTRQVASITASGIFTTERNLLFERSDLAFSVWAEGERDLTEYTLLAECLGRTEVEPPAAWALPDPILLIRLDDETGTLNIGQTVLTGGDSIYERIEESEFGQFTRVITQTAVVSEDMIAFSYYAIADERDDCELRYETTFIPFDGDYEALFVRAAELGAGE